MANWGSEEDGTKNVSKKKKLQKSKTLARPPFARRIFPASLSESAPANQPSAPSGIPHSPNRRSISAVPCDDAISDGWTLILLLLLVVLVQRFLLLLFLCLLR